MDDDATCSRCGHPKRLDIVGGRDIAKMAGVGNAAVVNWAKRHANFPTPCARPSGMPVWHRADVVEWLERTGRIPRSGAGSWSVREEL